MMMSSMASVKFIKTKFKPSFIKFGSRNQMLFMFKFQHQNEKKRKSGKSFFGLDNGAIRRLQTGAAFRDYKSGQEGLQKGGSFRDFKSGQKNYKSVQNILKGIF